MRNAHILALAYSGRLPHAYEELREAEQVSTDEWNVIDARFRLDLRYGNARRALAMLRQHGTSEQHEAFLIARIEPSPSNVERAIAMARTSSARTASFGSLLHVLAAFGRFDEIFNVLIRTPALGRDDSISVVFRPDLKPFRQHARFLQIARRFGLLDYWQKSGRWPDFCFEPGLPYDCKSEAAKLTG